MGNEGSQPVQYGEPIENDTKIVWGKFGKETPFPGREGHCSCCVGNALYTFGGVTLSGDEGLETNDVLKFDTEKEEWSEIKCSGTIPRRRSAAAIASVDKKLFMFGGMSADIGWLNDLHVFDTESCTWTKVSCEGVPPSARDKLACAVIGDHIYYFGGFGPKAAEVLEDDEENSDEEEEEEQGAEFGWFNDLFIFDTKSSTWSSPMQMNLSVPTARAAHGMCAVNKHIVIFGGRDTEKRTNDLHIFDTESRKWIADLEKVVSGRQPEPRSFHTLTTVGERVVVSGGRNTSNQHLNDFHIFDTNTKEWLQPAVEGDLPKGRGRHTTTLVGDKVVIFGGSSDFQPEINQCQTFHNDLFYVNAADVKTGKSVPVTPSENQENVPAVASKEANSKQEKVVGGSKQNSANILGEAAVNMETAN